MPQQVRINWIHRLEADKYGCCVDKVERELKNLSLKGVRREVNECMMGPGMCEQRPTNY